jgi:2-(3-amino-3-carboxypropyl)histidine synthase
MVLNFEEEKLITELKKQNPKRVLVQLPEGLKNKTIEIKGLIEELGIETIFSGETAWGGCSIALQEAKDTESDLIVHFGHAKFIDSEFPVIYIEIRDELDLMPILKKSLDVLKGYKKIGLSYSIQHRHDIELVKRFYEGSGKKIFLSEKRGYAAYEGHVIGCEYAGLKTIESDVDCFVVIGNRFHSLGASLAVKKPVILLDVYNNEVKSMDGFREKIIQQRFASIQKFREAKNVGVIIETKPGQKFGPGKYLADKLKEKGKEPVLITMSEVTPDKITNFSKIDAFVELACPRIAIDDFSKYPKPILTFKEAMIAIDERKWEDAVENGLL